MPMPACDLPFKGANVAPAGPAGYLLVTTRVATPPAQPSPKSAPPREP